MRLGVAEEIDVVEDDDGRRADEREHPSEDGDRLVRPSTRLYGLEHRSVDRVRAGDRGGEITRERRAIVSGVDAVPRERPAVAARPVGDERRLAISAGCR